MPLSLFPSPLVANISLPPQGVLSATGPSAAKRPYESVARGRIDLRVPGAPYNGRRSLLRAGRGTGSARSAPAQVVAWREWSRGMSFLVLELNVMLTRPMFSCFFCVCAGRRLGFCSSICIAFCTRHRFVRISYVLSRMLAVVFILLSRNVCFSSCRARLSEHRRVIKLISG